jgi:multidrug resistance efflux pump
VLAAGVAIAVGLWFVPMDYTIQAPVVVSPRRESVVRALEPGRIEAILVEAGDRVEEGDPLVRMSNPQLKHRAQQVREQLRAVEARLRAALAQDGADYRVLQNQKQQLAEEARELEERLERLVLRAPHDGVVADPRLQEIKAEAPRHDFVSFPEPDHRAGLDALRGATVQAGTGILSVGATDSYYFETFVYEHDMSYLSASDRMVCKLRSDAPGEYESRVQSITPVDVKSIENMGITLADVGYIPVKPSPAGEQKPLVTLYRLRSRPQDAAEPLHWGATGKARITYDRGPMGRFYFTRLVRALRLRLQRA